MKAERSTKPLRSKQQGAVGTSVAKYPKKTTKKGISDQNWYCISISMSSCVEFRVTAI